MLTSTTNRAAGCCQNSSKRIPKSRGYFRMRGAFPRLRPPPSTARAPARAPNPPTAEKPTDGGLLIAPLPEKYYLPRDMATSPSASRDYDDVSELAFDSEDELDLSDFQRITLDAEDQPPIANRSRSWLALVPTFRRASEERPSARSMQLPPRRLPFDEALPNDTAAEDNGMLASVATASLAVYSSVVSSESPPVSSEAPCFLPSM